MINWLKAFFQKTYVQIVGWVFVGIGTLILLLGGIKVEDLQKLPALVFGILQAIGLLIVFISGFLKLKEATAKKDDEDTGGGKITFINTSDSEEDRQKLNPDAKPQSEL